MSATELDLKFSPEEQAILQDFENARHLRDTLASPGWGVFIGIMEKRLEQVKAQFLSAKVDKESLWAMQVRLNGITEFWDVLIEGVNSAVECLDPVAMRQILELNRMKRTDLDGEVGLPEL